MVAVWDFRLPRHWIENVAIAPQNLETCFGLGIAFGRQNQDLVRLPRYDLLLHHR